MDVSFQTLVNSASSILVIAGPDGRYRFVNAFAEEVLGWSPEELQSRPFLDFVHPDDLEATLASLRRHVDGHGQHGFENRYRRKDGDFVWLRWYSNTGPDGTIYATAIEVTNEVAQRQRNLQLEELHNAAAQLAKMGVYEVDLTTGRAWWSDEVKRIHDVPMDYEPQLDKAIEFYAPEARPTVQASIDYAIETGNTWNFELPFITAKGRRRWVRAFGRAEYDEAGTPIKLRGGFQDITEWHDQQMALADAMRRAEENSEAKSRFLATMSHELRNPVNGIMGVLQLLEQTELQPDQRQLLQLMADSGRSLTRLLDQVLQSHRLEAGDEPLELQPLDLAALCNRVVEAGRPLRPDLQLFCHTAKPCWFEGDVGVLRQILDNLMSNALKYTERGSVSVALRIQDGAQEISVVDTGPGIAPEHVDSIFERFRRIEPSNVHAEGSGLGLSIARQLAERHGGLISVNSRPNVGSTFTLRVHLSPAPLPTQAKPPTGETRPLPTALRVLLADDEKISRFVAKGMLEAMGVQVHEAVDGEQAVRLAQQLQPDIILMDCIMPKCDGWTATERLRAQGYEGVIIALTGSATERDIERTYEAGMNDHLAKPFRAKHLKERLANWAPGACNST